MSYVVKGFAGVTLVKFAPQYNAESKTLSFVTEYQGTEAAVRGLEPQLQFQGYSYRTDHDGPVWTLWLEEPVQDVDQDLDRWEIFTESTDKSIFELPDMISEANTYDAGLAEGADTFREACEKGATQKPIAAIAAIPNAMRIIKHLRSGVNGWQVDLVGLRRTRRMGYLLSQGAQLNLDTGLYIFTTAQLQLPGTVAFVLPATPPDITTVIGGNTETLFRWGWRKRGQRTEIVGSFVEQTVDLLFAPWSMTEYASAAGNLAW